MSKPNDFLASYSEIKKTSLVLLGIIDELAQPHLNNAVVKRFWNWFFVSHGKNVILSMQDKDLKAVMEKGYKALKPIYEKADLATNIKESRQLNTGPMQKFIEERLGKEVLDIVPEL